MSKRQLDPLSEYLAMENGALTRKMRKMTEEHHETLTRHWTKRLEDDAQIQELQNDLNEADERINLQEETMAISRQRLIEQHIKIRRLEEQWRKDTFEILKMRRLIQYYRNKEQQKIEEQKNGETTGETTEEE